MKLRFWRKAAAPAGPVTRPVPLCVVCARDGLVVEGEALLDPDRPEAGRLCETHLLAQEHHVETATGLHPAELWALREGGEFIDDGEDRRGSVVHRPEVGR